MIPNGDRPVLVYGDPHGEWRPLLRAVEETTPEAILIVGDCDLDEPLRRVLREVFADGIPVHYVLGNHDTDRETWFRHLVEDHPEGNFHGKVLNYGGMRIAGLGGVYRGQVWYPEVGDELPDVLERSDLIAMQRKVLGEERRLPLRHHSTIFPEDHFVLEGIGRRSGVDVLITHEAPAPNPVLRHGMAGIAKAVEACRARLVVHGHHHQSYEAEMATRSGHRFAVRGLGIAEIARLTPLQ